MTTADPPAAPGWPIAGLLVGLLVSIMTLGTETATAQSAGLPRPDCRGPEHRQLDFWVGDWIVTAGDRAAGTNRITLEEDGCLLREQWRAVGGTTGQSINFYDRTTGEWHQIWVDNSGNVLRFRGRLEGASLVYRGSTPRSDGGRTDHRMTFTPNADGSVRQVWESSGDGGATWSVAFDGTYRRRPAG